VRIETDFLAPSRLGDKVLFGLEILALGQSSLQVEITARLGDQVRMRAKLTLVWIDGMKAAPWPDAMRAKMVTFKEGAV
jgi:4-hydroxybenzoyl-CoA thioesterase